MNGNQRNLVESAIRQLRWRVMEQKQALAALEERFPQAYLESIEDVLIRFERRLGCERISAPCSAERDQGVKPQPEPDTGRGVSLSGNNPKESNANQM